MKSFQQFCEDAIDHNPFGFLRPHDPEIAKKGKDRPRWDHHRIALKNGFNNVQQAIDAGWVRYNHYPLKNQAAYEFKHGSEKLVADHIKKSEPFKNIAFIVHNQDGVVVGDHYFNNKAALKFLSRPPSKN